MLFKSARINISLSLVLGVVLILCCLERTPTSAKTITVTTTTTTTDDECTSPIPPADQVATLIHNAIRITHGVPALTFSLTLKTVAQSCADYHATQGTDLVVAPGPDVTCPTITEAMAESWNYIEIPPIASDSQLYRSVIWGWYISEPDPNYEAPVYGFDYRHKVQMIWRSTTTFACARSSFAFPNPPVAGIPSRIYVSCIYSPPGNDQVTPNAFAQNVFRDSI